MKISIVYSSETHHTQRLAEAIHIGCHSVDNINSQLIQISDEDFQASRWSNEKILAELDDSDAIIFGSPTFMGSVSSKMQAFMEATVSRFLPETWNGKIAAGFTVSGGTAGDKFNTLSTLTTFSMQHGMIWVGLGCNPFNETHGINACGHYYGATGRAAPDDDPDKAPSPQELKEGQYLGARVAFYVTQLAK
ncbi:MAG: hypothetical protein COB04_15745 [Gammaproteobacteria bacterium]|nr:MAG: hypothetical protein COB04_15745 [Gammaproteobacteria bacterium]